MPLPILTSRSANKMADNKPVCHPDIDQPIDVRGGWQEAPGNTSSDSAFKMPWEMFRRHVALDTPWLCSTHEGATGVQLAEPSLAHARERRWIDVQAR